MGLNPRSPAEGASAAGQFIQKALLRHAEAAPFAFAVTRGPEHRLVYVNTAFGRVAAVGDAPGTPIGDALAEKAPGLSAILDQSFRDAVALMDVGLGESRGDGTSLRLNVWPVIGDDGRTEALVMEIREEALPDPAMNLQREVAEQMLLGALRERELAEYAEVARKRAAFLAEAGRLLAESVDQTSTLLALTKVVLPILGAWCIVDILDEDGTARRLGIYHSDPGKQQVARKLVATWMPDPDDPFGAPAMIREARTAAIAAEGEDVIAALARSADNVESLRQLGIGPMLTVPLVTRGRLLGAITFVSADPGFVYSPEDVHLAEDLAARGALALDNAQVHEMALVQQRRAESANKAKTAFLGAMSHELRTPLNAIGGYIDLLDMGLRGPVTEEQHADFARVRSNQQHLALLITEILNFTRMGSGRGTYSVSDIKCCDAIQRAVDMIEPLFARNELVFDGISGDSSLVARADPERVAQVLVNLLSNAIKFTPAGGHISADCTATPHGVALRVSDTGIGIDAEKIEVIFEPFIQLQDGLADRESGVGLGLAISRDLARGMLGDLTVESTMGKGASFTLSLPAAQSATDG